MANSRGFTLLEIVVVVGIISAVTAYASLAYPSAREQQKIIMAEQILQSTMRETQQKAINEERDAKCVERFKASSNPADEKYCSDLGLHFNGSRIVLFADTHKANDNLYDAADDFELGTAALPDGVTITGLNSLIFQGIPPTVKMYANGIEIDLTTKATIQIGNSKEVVTLGPYGQVSK